MRLEHQIFQGPTKPEIELRETDTPQNYKLYPEGRDLPARIPVWAVQQGKLGEEVDFGLVSSPWGFEDSPDAEVISAGINSKGPNSVALARQANLFLWGFAGDPRQMTKSGRQVFVNAVSYMHSFEGHRLLVRKEGQGRDHFLFHASRLGHEDLTEDIRRYCRAKLPQALNRVHKGEVEPALRNDLEFTYLVGDRLEIDADVKALGVSNRSPALLDAIEKRLESDPEDGVARRLLERYLPQGLSNAITLKEWRTSHEGRIFFSDVGGFRWFVDTNPPMTRRSAADRGR